MTDLLCLFRSEEARQVALGFLADWPPRERARLLLDCLRARRAAVAPEIVGWLYDAWAGGEHELLDGVTVPCYDPQLLNDEIALRSPDQPRSRALLLAQWRRAEGEQRERLLRRWWQIVGEVPASEAQSREELAELAHAKEARRLRASERDFLQWAVAQEADLVVRFYGVEALEHLGEESREWRDQLALFARGEDPYLRLRAAAALSRRGDTARRDEVIAALTAEHACVRAEALCLLAEADVRQHRSLLRGAMTEQPDRCDYHRHGPCAAFDAAWRGLMRLDPPEALTELIQCCLMLPGLHNTHQLQQVFEALVSGCEPAETAGRFFEPRWRRCWGEESQEDWPDLRYALRRSGRG